jgi:hypothetical protein
MGSCSRSSAGVIGASIAASLAAIALSKSDALKTKYDDGSSPSRRMSKRQLVREWFREMANASECGEGGATTDGRMPWSLYRASGTSNDGADERDHSLHFSLY